MLKGVKTSKALVFLVYYNIILAYGEDKFFMINFNDPNAYTQYGKEILVTISSGE